MQAGGHLLTGLPMSELGSDVEHGQAAARGLQAVSPAKTAQGAPILQHNSS